MSDWNKTRINKSNTNLFYKKGWKVSIADVETLTQWLEVNIPFPVRVTREEKYLREIDSEKNPIIISADNKYNLEEFLPLIKKSFKTTYAVIINENKFSFKIIIRQLRINDGKKSLNYSIKHIYCISLFETIEQYDKVRNIVYSLVTSDKHPLFPEKEVANGLDESPSDIIKKMNKGFWVSKRLFEKWIRKQNEAYEIFGNIAY